MNKYGPPKVNMPKNMPRRCFEFRAWDGHRMFHVEHLEQLNSPDLYVMQYTGLVDVDGKKIFDGDIMASLTEGVTAVVAWWPQVAAFECRNTIRRIRIEMMALTARRIIGNIWENRDTLRPLGTFIW